MRRIAIALIVLASMSVITSAHKRQPHADSRAEDETAIKAIVQQMQDGWNAGNGKAFAAPFAEDADYVIVNGMRLKGRDVIASMHQRIFDTFYKNSQNRGDVKSVRFLRPDIAIAHVEWTLKFMENGNNREAKAINSIILSKENRQWGIAAFQNTYIEGAKK